MNLAAQQNFLCKPSHKISRDSGGNYIAPPQSAKAQPAAVAAESGAILLDENGNAILEE
jgi:hypothetical protein